MKRDDSSVSRALAQWAAATEYDGLPPAVIDKIRALTLQALASAVIGNADPSRQHLMRMFRREEGVTEYGATILGEGSWATKAGAAYLNAGLIHSGGRLDMYRVLTHPGNTIIPAALAMAEPNGNLGRELITAIAVGYEVSVRIAGDWIPSVQARGFRSSPIFGLFGAAVASGKLLELTEDELTSTIALCAELAAGNLEGARTGARSLEIHEPSAARNAILAALLAQSGVRGSETALEGAAGFYHAYAGGLEGIPPFRFRESDGVELATVTADLGSTWRVLDVALRTRVISGYNMPVVSTTAQLCREHDIAPTDVEQVTIEMNWIEASYPSPAFKDPTPASMNTASPHYCCALSLLHRGYPIDRTRSQPGSLTESADEVAQLMNRITLTPSRSRSLLEPRITITTSGGRTYTRTATGREFMLTFDETRSELERLSATPQLEPCRLARLTSAVQRLHADGTVSDLISATLQ